MEFTKERIELFIKSPLEHGLTRSEQMEMARQLLAGLEQEPVAWTTGVYRQNVGCNFGEKVPGEAPCIAAVYWDRNTFKHDTDCQETSDRWLAEAIKNTEAKPLYAAPQLPQPAVIEDDKFRADFERWMVEDEKCIVGSSDPYPAGIESRNWRAWKACRAAMLQNSK